MLLTELLKQYTEKRLRGGSPNTVRLYRHSITSFQKTIGHRPTIDDLTDELIEKHMWRLVSDGGSPASANKDRSQLTCLWRWASRKGIIKTWPDVAILKEPEQIPMGWLPDEVASLLEACRQTQGMLGNVKSSVWWESLFRGLLDSGERIGAMLQLNVNCLQDRWLLVPAGTRKGKTRDRLYPLQSETLECVRQVIGKRRSGPIWDWPYSSTYLYKHLNAVLEAANLPTDRRSKFHRVRRTVASAVARAGGDPTAALDHASPKTTRKYLDPRIVGGEDVSDILARYLSDPHFRAKLNPINQHKRTG